MNTPQRAARTLLVAWLTLFAGAASPSGAADASTREAIETVKEFVAANVRADLARILDTFDDVAVVTAHLAALPSAPVLEPTVFPRRTFVLRRAGQRWRIVHDHASHLMVEPSRS